MMRCNFFSRHLTGWCAFSALLFSRLPFAGQCQADCHLIDGDNCVTGCCRCNVCDNRIAWQLLARVLSWGHGRGLIIANPCERGGRVYRSSRAESVWTEDDEKQFPKIAPPHLHLPLIPALWTSQMRLRTVTRCETCARSSMRTT